jgi:hypothetical protein
MGKGKTNPRAVKSPDDLEGLFPSYGIIRTGNDAVDYRNLALRLAQEPLSSAVSRGARTRSPFALTALHATVESIKSQSAAAGRRCTDTMAISILADDPVLAPIWLKHRSVRTLRNWLVEAKDPKKNPVLAGLQKLDTNGFPYGVSAALLRLAAIIYGGSCKARMFSSTIEKILEKGLTDKKYEEFRARFPSWRRSLWDETGQPISALDRAWMDLFLAFTKYKS